MILIIQFPDTCKYCKIVSETHVCVFSGSVTYSVSVSSSTGRFEVSEKGELAADGFIHALTTPPPDQTPPLSQRDDHRHEEFLLNSDDFYKELRVRGYEYGREFCSVQAAAVSGETKHLSKN